MTSQSQPVGPDSSRPADTDDAPVTYSSLTEPADSDSAESESDPESAPAFLSGMRPSFWPDNFIL